MQTTTSTPPTRRDLATIGFSRPEIERLIALRTGYDGFRERCENNTEYERLSFLKWRYQQGRAERG
jgi:hypothetical protein